MPGSRSNPMMKVAGKSGWDRASGSPPPELPPHVVAETRERYLAAYELLTGTPLST